MKYLQLAMLFCLFAAGSAVAQISSAQPRELDHIIAVVNDEVITSLELDKRVRLIKQQLKQKNTRLPSDSVLRRQILERMVIEQIQLQVAQRVGIRIDDETVNRVINNIARENRLTIEQFSQVLAKDGFDFPSFRQNIKNEITINQLRKRRVENKVTVTEQEVDNHLANISTRKGINDEYHLGHILIAVPEGATPTQIQAAKDETQKVLNRLRLGANFAETAIAVSAGQLALKGGDLGWRKGAQLPTLFSDVAVTMRVGDISEPIRSASGFHIIKVIDRRSSQKRHIVNQTLARHILIRPNQIISSNEARRRLQRIRDRILTGEDFAQLARAHSDDTGSAAKGGSLGWYNPGTMVPQFEETANKLKPGEISEPFRSNFGWHIVQVMSRRTHDDTQQFQRVQARQLIARRKTEEAVENWLREIRSESYVEYRINQ